MKVKNYIHTKHREVKPSEFFKKFRACSPPSGEFYILLLAVELYKGGEHTCDLLIVSVSMSI